MNERFEEIRGKIAANDEAIVAAVNRRLELVAELWELKAELGLDTVDPDRERRLREQLAAANAGPLSAGGLDRLVTELLDLTKHELGRRATPARRSARPRARRRTRPARRCRGSGGTRPGRGRRATSWPVRRREASSSSPSNSTPDSSITSSAAKIFASRAQRERDRVRRARVELDLGAVPDERDQRVERAVAQLGDGDLADLGVERGDDRGREVVGHRPWRLRALQVHQDRRRLGVADPDGKERVAVLRLQQHDRLLADQVEAHAVDGHLAHRRHAQCIPAGGGLTRNVRCACAAPERDPACEAGGRPERQQDQPECARRVREHERLAGEGERIQPRARSPARYRCDDMVE